MQNNEQNEVMEAFLEHHLSQDGKLINVVREEVKLGKDKAGAFVIEMSRKDGDLLNWGDDPTPHRAFYWGSVPETVEGNILSFQIKPFLTLAEAANHAFPTQNTAQVCIGTLDVGTKNLLFRVVEVEGKAA